MRTIYIFFCGSLLLIRAKRDFQKQNTPLELSEHLQNNGKTDVADGGEDLPIFPQEHYIALLRSAAAEEKEDGLIS